MARLHPGPAGAEGEAHLHSEGWEEGEEQPKMTGFAPASFHEAGHSLLALMLPGASPLVSVSVSAPFIGLTKVVYQSFAEMSEEQLQANLLVAVGGREGEKLGMQHSDYGDDRPDVLMANQLAGHLLDRGTAPRQAGDVEAVVEQYRERARTVLVRSQPQHSRLANWLMANPHRLVTGEDARRVVEGEAPLAAPLLIDLPFTAEPIEEAMDFPIAGGQAGPDESPGGDDFAYVFDNDVFYQPSPSASHSLQLTNESGTDLLNGLADWLYEEEILQSPDALWWSGDGQLLVYLTIDNRQVPHVPITYFAERQYPFVIRQPYPKTGDQHLPQVWLNIWHKKGRRTKRMAVEGIAQGAKTYLFSAQWARLHGQQVLIAVWANRYQNQTTISLCSFDSAQCVPNLVQKFAFDDELPAIGQPSPSPSGHLRLWGQFAASAAPAANGSSSSSQFVYLSCKGPGTPHVLVAKLEKGDKLETVLEFGRNEALEQALLTHKLPRVHFERIRLKNGVETLANVLVPYGVSLEEQKPEAKFPVLVDVYAGPGTQKVTQERLCSNMHVIFFSSALDFVNVFIDVHGSGHRGWHVKQPLYGFDTVEVDDQIKAMRELLRRFPILDERRVALWGSARAIQWDQHVNMPYQNTAEFVRSMTEDIVQFQMMFYTDDSHTLSAVRWRLYTMLSQFLQKCFAK